MDDQTYNMDVEDLFGDSEQVTIPSIPVPPVKGLAQRVSELIASGCCQKLAWSKNGCVAYITKDGQGVNLRVFSRDPSTGKWDLGKDSSLDIPRRRESFPFVHISWSHLGNDIAVIDAAGHVMIFSCMMALDRMTYMRTDLGQPDAEMDAVVGMHWLAILPYEQKNHIAWSASNANGTWDFSIASHVFSDAHHPVEGKASLIYLKKHGELKLRFQQTDNSWQEASAVLGPMVTTREPFTHAAFASNNDNTLLLAAYDNSERLHLYRVEVTWNVQPPKPGHQPHQPKHFDKPDLKVTEITIENNCGPNIVNSDLTGGPESKINVPAKLTHLNFLPTTPQKDDGTVPTIQAIFATPTNVASFDQTPQQNPFSIVAKWEVRHTQQNHLHPSLDKVTSKKKSVSSVPTKGVFTLKRVSPDVVMHSVIVSFVPLWYNMILAFCHSDGTIEFRKRSTGEVITPDYNTDTVTSLPQAGFTFSPTEPSLNVALSPNHCMAVTMQQDSTLKLRSMEYQYGTLATDDFDPKHSAALAALVLQSASAANQYFSSDDIFAIIGPLTEKRKSEFISLLFDGLKVDIDCGISDTSQNHLLLLGRSPTFVKTLSAAHLLGLKGSVDRTLTSKMSWIILNIKYITQILTTIARMHGQIEKNPLRPEVVPQFIGICRWIMHFMVYMIDELLVVGRVFKGTTPDKATLEAKLHELNKPALLILLSSFPRMMMKLWSNPLTWVVRTAFTTMNNNPSHELRALYSPLHQALSDIPFDWRLFDQLVSEAHHLVRSSYQRASMQDRERGMAERQLILGHIPDVLFPAARRLVTDTLFNDTQPNGCLADKLDPAKIYFFDTTWLGFQESRRANEWFNTHVVDVCQKMIIRGTGTQVHPTINSSSQNRGRSDSTVSTDGKDKLKERHLRRCVRCAAYMEDVRQGMPGYGDRHFSWLMGVAKHCVCGNSWVLAEEKKGAP